MIAGWDVPIHRAVAAGIVATAAMEVFLVELTPRLGWGKVNYPRLLGTLLLGNFEVPESVWCLLAGGLLFLAGGIGWSLIYVYFLYDHLVGPAWFQGLTSAGIGVFLFSTFVFFPVLSWIHPWVRAGLVAVPSLFGPGLPEGRLVVGTVAAFCLRIAAQRFRAAAAIALRPAALRRRLFGAFVTLALFAGEAFCALR